MERRIANNAEFPTEWEGWRALIERFNLEDETPLKEWAAIVDAFIKLGWNDASPLARVGKLFFTRLIAQHHINVGDIQLWKAAVLLHADSSAGATMTLKGASGNAEILLTRLNAVTLADSAVRKDVSRPTRMLRMPKSFSELGPTAKLNKLRQASVSKNKTTRFFRTASHMRALEGVRFFAFIDSRNVSDATISFVG